MTRTNLTGPRLIIESDGNGSVRVTAAYGWTSTDGDLMSKTRDLTADLTAAQLTSATTWLAAVTARLKTVDNIT